MVCGVPWAHTTCVLDGRLPHTGALSNTIHTNLLGAWRGLWDSSSAIQWVRQVQRMKSEGYMNFKEKKIEQLQRQEVCMLQNHKASGFYLSDIWIFEFIPLSIKEQW